MPGRPLLVQTCLLTGALRELMRILVKVLQQGRLPLHRALSHRILVRLPGRACLLLFGGRGCLLGEGRARRGCCGLQGLDLPGLLMACRAQVLWLSSLEEVSGCDKVGFGFL